MDRKHSLSVILIARDEADRIRACLESVRDIADEIVVLDSGSRDGTVAIAREYTPHVFETDWPGDGIQKQRALDKATGDWVFRIDADERMSAELVREIRQVLERDTIAQSAFEVRWATWFFGRYLTRGEAGVAHLNLFRREGASYGDRLRHAPLHAADGPIGRLEGRLLHHAWRDLHHLLTKLDDYACATAEQDAARGRKGGALRAVAHAFGRFWQAYVYRLGFLDGTRGLILAVLYSQYAFNKYVALWAREQPGPPGDPGPRHRTPADTG